MPIPDVTTEKTYLPKALRTSTKSLDRDDVKKIGEMEKWLDHDAQEQMQPSASDEVIYNYDHLRQNKKLYNKAFKDPGFLNALRQYKSPLPFDDGSFEVHSGNVKPLEAMDVFLSQKNIKLNSKEKEVLKGYVITGDHRRNLILDFNARSNELETTKQMLAYAQKKQGQLTHELHKTKLLKPERYVLFKSRRNERRNAKLRRLEDSFKKHFELSNGLAAKTDALTDYLSHSESKIFSAIKAEAEALQELKKVEAKRKKKVYEQLSKIHHSKLFEKTQKQEHAIAAQTKEFIFTLNLKDPDHVTLYNHKILSSKKFTAFYNSQPPETIGISTALIKHRYNAVLTKLLEKKQAHLTRLNVSLQADTSEYEIYNLLNNNKAIRELLPELTGLLNDIKLDFDAHMAVRLRSHKQLKSINRHIRRIESKSSEGKVGNRRLLKLIPLKRKQEAYLKFDQALEKHIETLANSIRTIHNAIKQSKVTLISNLKHLNELSQGITTKRNVEENYEDINGLLQLTQRVANGKNEALYKENALLLEELKGEIKNIGHSETTHTEKLIKYQNLIHLSNEKAARLRTKIKQSYFQNLIVIQNQLQEITEKFIKDAPDLKAFLESNLEDIKQLLKNDQDFNGLRQIEPLQRNLINILFTKQGYEKLTSDYIDLNEQFLADLNEEEFEIIKPRIALYDTLVKGGRLNRDTLPKDIVSAYMLQVEILYFSTKLTIDKNQKILRGHATELTLSKSEKRQIENLDKDTDALMNDVSLKDTYALRQRVDIINKMEVLAQQQQNKLLRNKLQTEFDQLNQDYKNLENLYSEASYHLRKNDKAKKTLQDYMEEAFKTNYSGIKFQIKKISGSSSDVYDLLKSIQAQIADESKKIAKIRKNMEETTVNGLLINTEIMNRGRKVIEDYKPLGAQFKTNAIAHLEWLQNQQNNMELGKSFKIKGLNAFKKPQDDFMKKIKNIKTINKAEELLQYFLANCPSDSELSTPTLKKAFQQNIHDMKIKAESGNQESDLEKEIAENGKIFPILCNLIKFNDTLKSIKDYDFVDNTLYEKLHSDYTQLKTKAIELMGSPPEPEAIEEALEEQENLRNVMESIMGVKIKRDDILEDSENFTSDQIKALTDFKMMPDDIGKKWEELERAIFSAKYFDDYTSTSDSEVSIPMKDLVNSEHAEKNLAQAITVPINLAQQQIANNEVNLQEQQGVYSPKQQPRL